MPAYIIYTRFITLHLVIMLNLPKAANNNHQQTENIFTTASFLAPCLLCTARAAAPEELVNVCTCTAPGRWRHSNREINIHRRAVRGKGRVFPKVHCFSTVCLTGTWAPFLHGEKQERHHLFVSDFPHPIRTSFQNIPVVGGQDNLIDFHRCGLSGATFQQERLPRRKQCCLPEEGEGHSHKLLSCLISQEWTRLMDNF